ncbi:thioredoxin-like protein HCF164, chloroplastic [Silene latifolia]|uniref:thioredoxin-like protein HCF164, chloroplastic n=1 Tax=Silene latifolia TaxID=37657 RepID=UPI003D7812F0
MALHFSSNLVTLQRLPTSCDYYASPRILLQSKFPLQLKTRRLQYVACQGETTESSPETESSSTEPDSVDDKSSQATTSSTSPSFPEFPNKDVNKRVALLSTFAAVGLFLSARLDFGVSLRDLTAMALPYEEALSNGKPTVVEFYADWCEVCRELAPDVYKVEQQYKDQVNFVMLNVDNTKWEQELDEFGVEGIPHFAFLDKDGNEEGNVVGRLPRKYLLENVDALARGEESIPHARAVGQYSSAEFRKIHQVGDPRSHG